MFPFIFCIYSLFFPRIAQSSVTYAADNARRAMRTEGKSLYIYSILYKTMIIDNSSDGRSLAKGLRCKSGHKSMSMCIYLCRQRLEPLSRNARKRQTTKDYPTCGGAASMEIYIFYIVSLYGRGSPVELAGIMRATIHHFKWSTRTRCVLVSETNSIVYVSLFAHRGA